MKKNRDVTIDRTMPQHVLFHKDETYESGPRNGIMALNPEYIFEGADLDPILNISTGYIYLFADLLWVNMYGYDIKYGDGCADWIIGD